MHTKRPRLILVQSTDSPVQLHLSKGIWERQLFSLTQYAKEFDVKYYTSDIKNQQEHMPVGVQHMTGRLTSGFFGWGHILYYIFLIRASFQWRSQKDAVVRVIGVNVPVIPILRLISRKKFVISYQFDWAYGMKKDYKGIKPAVSVPVQSLVIRSADHLLCTTNWLSEIARKRYRIPPERITIIPNYVNVDLFRPDRPKKKQVAFAGRLHWSKGIDTLILAFNKFSSDRPDYKLIIMGSGEEEDSLKKLVKPTASVEFMGSVSNSVVASVFNQSEIFVLPTVNMEGHPKALVEAMAAGCKCITSDVPGNNHVLLESGTPDLLFPSQDAESLYSRLVYATAQQDDKQYNFALENYSSKICFEKEIEILRHHAP